MQNSFLYFVKILFVLFFVSLWIEPAHGRDSSSPEATTVEAVVDPSLAPHIVVNVAARRLYFYDQGQVIKTYPVAVGSPSFRTPLGERELTQIVWNPWWLPPTSNWAKGASPTPPGPNNPMGPVKMDLGNAILFHGTNKPKSIGLAASHGCMRMNSDDAKEFARFIQEKYTFQNDTTLFDKYEKNRRQSFHVKLENPIPVRIVYEIAEVRDGKLNVFKDVYYKYTKKIKQQTIEQALLASGVDLAKIDAEAFFKTVTQSKSDLELEIEAIKSGSALQGPEKVAQAH